MNNRPRELRTAWRWSQADLADHLDVSRQKGPWEARRPDGPTADGKLTGSIHVRRTRQP